MIFIVTLAVRYLLVVLFFPFSALDKIINFKDAVGQARQLVPGGAASALILVGLAVEIVMPLGILTGIADRLAGFIMAGYCGVTALLFKRFWATGDFWDGSESKGRQMFWDFLKNFALAGGFLLLTVGINCSGLRPFLDNPLASSHPYATHSQETP